MRYQPIENHGIVGNLHTAALVGLDGSVDWLCLPRFDSPSVFGAILDADKGGRFRIAPAAADGLRHKQYYCPDTNVLPPLREREGDVPLLVHFLVARFAARVGVRIESVGEATIERLSRYSWPGNIRELENVLERAVILSNGPTLEIDPEVFASAAAARAANADPPTPSGSERSRPTAASAGPTPPLEGLESSTRSHILAALEKSGWVIDGPRGAAKILSLHPNTLRSRMKKLGIVRPSHEGQP
jgi:transcriptional regulator of acetoin/glycerol metabolism